jgi:hypothetical protein
VKRDEAAFLLGVSPDADPNTIRKAWRMWARIAHPDLDGDPEHFVRLDTARRILLQPLPAPVLVATPAPRPRPRPSWSQVVQIPGHPFAVCIAGILVVLLATLSGLSAIPFALTVAACAIAAAAWSVWATREALSQNADHGHRIAALALCWLPVAFTQVILSIIVDTSFVPVLPVLALPLVAAVAAVNPGAGLWRPVGR